MSAAMLALCGLLPLKGDESVWLVRGVRPFAREALLLLAKVVVLLENTEDATLVKDDGERYSSEASVAML